MKKFFAPAAGAVMLLSATAANAVISYNADLAPPGTYYGSGNPEGQWTINLENGLEVAMRGKIYQNPVLPVPVNNVYSYGLGETISFDWSFHNVDAIPLTNFTSQMTVTKVGVGSFVFDPAAIPDNDTHPDAQDGFQNSWRFWGFMGLNYDNMENATYILDWTVNSDASGPVSNEIRLVQGAGAVPEPATWAMMILGFGGTGAVLRNRRKVPAAA